MPQPMERVTEQRGRSGAAHGNTTFANRTQQRATAAAAGGERSVGPALQAGLHGRLHRQPAGAGDRTRAVSDRRRRTRTPPRQTGAKAYRRSRRRQRKICRPGPSGRVRGRVHRQPAEAGDRTRAVSDRRRRTGTPPCQRAQKRAAAAGERSVGPAFQAGLHGRLHRQPAEADDRTRAVYDRQRRTGTPPRSPDRTSAAVRRARGCPARVLHVKSARSFRSRENSWHMTS